MADLLNNLNFNPGSLRLLGNLNHSLLSALHHSVRSNLRAAERAIGARVDEHLDAAAVEPMLTVGQRCKITGRRLEANTANLLRNGARPDDLLPLSGDYVSQVTGAPPLLRRLIAGICLVDLHVRSDS